MGRKKSRRCSQHPHTQGVHLRGFLQHKQRRIEDLVLLRQADPLSILTTNTGGGDAVALKTETKMITATTIKDVQQQIEEAKRLLQIVDYAVDAVHTAPASEQRKTAKKSIRRQKLSVRFWNVLAINPRRSLHPKNRPVQIGGLQYVCGFVCVWIQARYRQRNIHLKNTGKTRFLQNVRRILQRLGLMFCRVFNSQKID